MQTHSSRFSTLSIHRHLNWSWTAKVSCKEIASGWSNQGLELVISLSCRNKLIKTNGNFPLRWQIPSKISQLVELFLHPGTSWHQHVKPIDSLKIKLLLQILPPFFLPVKCTFWDWRRPWQRVSLSPIYQTQPPPLESSWTMCSFSLRRWKALPIPKKSGVKKFTLIAYVTNSHSILINGRCLSCLEAVGCPTTQQPAFLAASISKKIYSHELSGCLPDGPAETLSQEQYVEQSSTETWRNAKYSMYKSQHSCWNHKVPFSLRSLCYDTIWMIFSFCLSTWLMMGREKKGIWKGKNIRNYLGFDIFFLWAVFLWVEKLWL